MTENSSKRFAIVGLGGRSRMYCNALTGGHAETNTLVALCDSNPGRLARAAEHVTARGADVATFDAGDFDRMLADARVDTVIVTTRDSAHDHYICRAMECGCDVITEKPMTIDPERCRRIIATQARTGRTCTVTFNYRYSPPRTQVKDLLMSGVIGEVLSVDFEWQLNSRHGADYFRRWHRNKANSGGLMVHKATHHFDLVNWWLSSVPETVFATGQRHFYTPRTADRFGLTRRGERCHGCPEAERCPFRLDLAAGDEHRRLYLECEHHDNYFRDRCVFSPEIDIEDSMQVVVGYRSGARLSYSLNAFCPAEGYHIVFNGSRGRLEHKCEESVYVNGDGSVPGALKREGTWIRIYPRWQPAYEVDVWTAKGGHGGGDPNMLSDLLSPEPPPDKYLRKADQRAGAWSILTGAAANISIDTGQVVHVPDLVPGLAEPDYPAMPDASQPLDLPPVSN